MQLRTTLAAAVLAASTALVPAVPAAAATSDLVRSVRTGACTSLTTALRTVRCADGSRTGTASVTVSRLRSAPTSPWAGTRFWVDPGSSAARDAAALRTSDPARAALLDRIATRPQGHWVGDWVPTTAVAAEVDRVLDAGAAARAVPVLVVYAVPHRDCGHYSAGGFSASTYLPWVRELARGMAGRRSLLVLEPDALSLLDCLTPEQQRERLALLAEARRVLEGAGARVYVDAGHSSWHTPALTASRLRAVGARGFALNTSNFRPTTDEVAFGRQVSSALGGARFVVDTSRNGLGPYEGAEAWCNPPGRALGTAPTGDPRLAGVDALLWVKRPGESDGTCRGGPSAGTWWQDYAVGLAARAAG